MDYIAEKPEMSSMECQPILEKDYPEFKIVETVMEN